MVNISYCSWRLNAEMAQINFQTQQWHVLSDNKCSPPKSVALAHLRVFRPAAGVETVQGLLSAAESVATPAATILQVGGTPRPCLCGAADGIAVPHAGTSRGNAADALSKAAQQLALADQLVRSCLHSTPSSDDGGATCPYTITRKCGAAPPM